MKTIETRLARRSRNLILFSILLASILFSVMARAETVTLAWDPNSESDLAGYRLHCGTASRNYTQIIDVGRVTQYAITNLSAGQTYYFAATAYNAAGNESGYSAEVSHTIPAPNSPPATPSVPSGASSALVAASITFTTTATDPNGDVLQYRFDWGGGVLSGWGAASQTKSWDTAGQYIVRAQARDSIGAESAWSGGRTVTISANQPPTVNAGADQTVDAGAAVTLNGTGSDPDNGVASWLWRQTSGTSVALSGTTTQQARFTAPAISTGSLSLVFEFRATDAAGLFAVDSCTVTVLSEDIDGDGVPNNEDAFPYDPTRWQENPDPAQNTGSGSSEAPANQAPQAPLLMAPGADEVTDAQPSLQTGAFSDPDPGDTHAETHWQLFRDEDSACVLDIRSGAALTSLTVPRLVLDEATAYFWRVRFSDSRGAASEWSNYGYFSTRNSGTDLNADGVPDAQEAGPTADLDRDGVKDYLQSHIKSLKMEGTNVQMGVSIKESQAALAIEYAESEDPNQTGLFTTGKFKRLPFGLINFRVAVAKPGDTAAVKIHFSEPAPRNGKWFKYDPISGSWYDFSALAKFAADRRSVTLTLRDGGNGDADGIANGVIVDPAGLVEIDGIGDGVSSGGGGCFIDTAGSGGSPMGLLGFLSLAGLWAAGWGRKGKCLLPLTRLAPLHKIPFRLKQDSLAVS
ncbi:MAG: choice-of-anchor U domain-containing protein [Desulfobacterales bacterium]